MHQPIAVTHNGHRAIVERSKEHPERYLWIRVGGRLFFLGVLVPGMTRRDVKVMALKFLRASDGHG